tara:strand:- start:11231 stop:11479 length:249 start_codon:yes stop_codon:yes gene_type:complete
MTEKTTKVWTTVATVNNFESANHIKNEIKEKYELVKIKRGGKGGSVFRIKAWSAPEVKEKRNKSKKSNAKKAGKHVDKKVRN